MPQGVSVIIPTYNRAKKLPNAMESVLKQTHTDLELIIVDDASQDHTENIVKKYMNLDHRIRYVKHDKNKGPAAARNTGINNSKKSYIAFLDSDDRWLPQKLEHQLLCLKESGDDWQGVYCGWEVDRGRYIFLNISNPFKPKIKKFGGKGLIPYVLMGTVLGCGSTLLIKRDVLIKLKGIDESFLLYEDWEILVRFLKKHKLAFLDEELVIIDRKRLELDTEKRLHFKKHLFNTFRKDILKYEKEGYPIISIHYVLHSKLWFRNANLEKGVVYLFRGLKYLRHRNLKFSLPQFLGIPKNIFIGLIQGLGKNNNN